ncbi:MAG: MBL fold metallo-hydrolase [Fimbriimonadaceae bacterium]
MIIRNFYERKLAQASYMVGCSASGEAIVIDPLRDIRPYTDMAASLGLRISAVTETHIHADFLSGARELSAATGATIYLSGEGGVDWEYAYRNDPKVVLLHDGDRIQVGNVSLRAIHTPGHTPEHLAFLLTDHPVSALPHSLFAGDFVFVGDVGRPDLLERAANIAGTMEAGARTLHRSLKKLRSFPDSLLLWPGHGAGSACGKSLGGSPVTTLGYERATNWAFLVADESKFVDEILSGQPDPPLYFKQMKQLNKEGPTVLGEPPHVARITTPVGQLIDIRDVGDIRRSSYLGAIAIPFDNSFTGWAGWIVRYDEPVTFIADSQQRVNDAARDLATIGLDSITGWIRPQDLIQDNFAPIHVISAKEIDRSATVLDVRGANERNASQLKGSIHIPFGRLRDRLGELPRDRKLIVQCAAGGRSPIAYTILRNAGFNDIWELPGGMLEAEQQTPELVSHA